MVVLSTFYLFTNFHSFCFLRVTDVNKMNEIEDSYRANWRDNNGISKLLLAFRKV